MNQAQAENNWLVPLLLTLLKLLSLLPLVLFLLFLIVNFVFFFSRLICPVSFDLYFTIKGAKWVFVSTLKITPAQINTTTSPDTEITEVPAVVGNIY